MAAPHALHEEFPNDAETIHSLKMSDARFARLISEYDSVNDQVENAASYDQPTDEAHEQMLRRQRARLKDEIARAIAQAKA